MCMYVYKCAHTQVWVWVFCVQPQRPLPAARGEGSAGVGSQGKEGRGVERQLGGPVPARHHSAASTSWVPSIIPKAQHV